MIETTTKHTFIDEMIKHGFSYDGARRILRKIAENAFIDEMIKHGFSYDGARALFAYHEHFELDAGISLTFDPIAFRCEWAEYKNIEELNKDYSHDYDFDDLCGDTQVIKVGEEGLIIQQF